MARKYITRLNFTKGVKPNYSPAVIPEDSLWDAVNADIDKSGLITKRMGTELYGPSLGLGDFKAISTALGYPLAIWQDGLYKFVNGSWQPILLTVFTGTHYKMIPWTFNGKPVVFILTGEKIYYTDGQTCTELTPYTPQAGEPENMFDYAKTCLIGCVRVSKSQRLALAKGNTIYFSAPLDPTYFPSDQFITLPEDGGKIVHLASRYNSLMIHRDKDRWAFFGSDVTDDLAELIKQDDVGCIDANSIVDVPEMGYIFAGKDNIYLIQGVSNIEEQTKAIPIGDDILTYYKRNIEETTGTCAIYYDNTYYLVFKGIVETERVFRLRIQNNMLNWFTDSGPVVSHLFTMGNELYGTKNGQIIKYSPEARTDCGTSIPFGVTFRHEAVVPGPVRFKKLFVFVQSTKTLQHLNAVVTVDGLYTETVELNISAMSGADFTIGESGIGLGRIGRLEEITVYEARLSGLKGHFIQVSLNSIGYDDKIALVGYMIEFKPKSRERGLRSGVVKK